MEPAEVYKTAVPSVFHVTSSHGFGTAFLARADGVALSNHHVVKGETTVRLQTHEGVVLSVPVISADADTDLAALLLPRSELELPTPLRFSGPNAARVGDEVVAIGHPAESAPFSLSRGVISALTYIQPPHSHSLELQANISVNWGNSGGPLLSLSACTVGIVTRTNFTPEGQRLEGVCLAVPSAVASDFLATIPDMSEGFAERRFCPACFNLVPDDAYCSHCGSSRAKQEHEIAGGPSTTKSSKTSLCTACQTTNPVGTRHCKQCGVRLQTL